MECIIVTTIYRNCNKRATAVLCQELSDLLTEDGTIHPQ